MTAFCWSDPLLLDAQLTEEERERLVRTIIAGLPGSEEAYTLDTLRARLALYRDVDATGPQGIQQFLEQHTSDGSTFGGRCKSTAWMGLSVCKRAAELTGDTQYLDDYRDMLVRVLDDLFDDVGSGTDADKRAVVREIDLIAPPLAPARDPRDMAYCSPVSAAQVLRTMIWNEVDSVVMTSATLTGGGDFQSFAIDNGLPDHAEMASLASPFDLPNQAELIVPNFPVTPDDREGQRLDNFLLGQLKGAPRSLVYKLVRSGQVRVNGGRAKAERKLAAGDEVRIPPVRLEGEAERGHTGQCGRGWKARCRRGVWQARDRRDG